MIWRRWLPGALRVDLSFLHPTRPAQSVDLTPLQAFRVVPGQSDNYDPPGICIEYADGSRGEVGSLADLEARSVLNDHSYIKRRGRENFWVCQLCGDAGPLDPLRARGCRVIPPPCADCGLTPECAPDCAGIARAFATAGVRVIK